MWPSKKRRRIEKYIRWKFRGNETGDVNGLLLAIEKNKVVGQLGLIPVKFKYRSEIYNAQWACDLMVDPELRKTGIGNKLFTEALSRDMVSLGNNPSPRAEKVMLSIGFKPVQSGRTMVFPLNVKHLMNWALPEKIKFAIPVAGRMIQPYYSLKKNSLLKIKSDFEIAEWKNLNDLITRRQESDDYTGIVHDIEFMSWRVEGLENFTPNIKTIKNKEGSYALHSEFKPYYQVYDWYCKDNSELKKMLSEITAAAIKTEAQTIQIVANSHEEEIQLGKAGFIKSRNIERIIYYSKKLSIDSKAKFYFTLYDTDLNL